MKINWLVLIWVQQWSQQYDEKKDGGESIQYTTTTKSISVWQFSCSQYTFFLTLFGVFK